MACLADKGHRIIGVDVDSHKLEILEAGHSPIKEPGLDGLISRLTSEGRIRVTDCAESAVQQSKVALVCVGTPSTADGSPDLDALKSVSTDIGHALRRTPHYYSVVYRSTVLPGTVEKHLIPILERCSGKRCGLEFGVGYNPEFMREGKGIYDFYHPARIVIGEYDPLTADRLEELYKGIDAPVVRESMRLAELIKYADNAFHALKIGFTNEVAMLAHQLGIDSRRLMEVFCLDTRLNISNSYLRPGFAFGGSCLPKDLRALTYLAHTLQVRTPILDSVLTSNREHIQRAIQLIKDNPSSSVGVIGLTFKPETDDVRESPALELVSELVAAGIKVWVMDSNLNANTIFGSNRRYIEEKFPTIWDHLVEDINGLLAYTDCIVITRDLQDKELRAVSRAVDTHRVIDLSGALYQRISHPNVVHLC